jgi:hypothetical protein
MISVATSTAKAKYRLKITLCSSSGVPPHFPSLYFAFRSLHVKVLLRTLPTQDCEVLSSAQVELYGL